MRDEHKDSAPCLAKAEAYRQKAEVVRDPSLKSALEAVARKYLAKAHELDARPYRKPKAATQLRQLARQAACFPGFFLSRRRLGAPWISELSLFCDIILH